MSTTVTCIIYNRASYGVKLEVFFLYCFFEIFMELLSHKVRSLDYTLQVTHWVMVCCIVFDVRVIQT